MTRSLSQPHDSVRNQPVNNSVEKAPNVGCRAMYAGAGSDIDGGVPSAGPGGGRWAF